MNCLIYKWFGIVELLCVPSIVFKRRGLPLSAEHFLNLSGISLKNVAKKIIAED